MNRSRIVIGALIVSLAAFFGAAAVANASITVYYYDDEPATFVVPPGVNSIQVVAVGGRGGRNGGGGTVGATVTGTFPVTPGASLGVNVAGNGTNCIGGKNGGGSVRSPCQQSGGGGGASDIRTGAGLGSRIMVAGGGGGYGGDYVSAAGGNGGQAGTSDCVKQAQPGTQSAGGAAGGTCDFYNAATAGTLGQGGSGGNYVVSPTYAGDSGGGGGGGLYGGGGASAGGGAGGSSLTSSGGTVTIVPNAFSPYIAITYSGNTLTVNTAGTGSGIITSTPAGIDCGRNVTGHSACSKEFAPGEEVTLEANGGLSGYTGCSSVNDQTCTVTMNQARSVTGTFGPATPSLSLTSYDAYLTDQVSTTASLQGGRSTPTGSIAFKLYGSNDSNCSGAPVYSKTVSVNGTGDYPSNGYTPTQPGQYRWTATYSGDSNNNSVSVACNGPNASSTVYKAYYYPDQNPTDATLGGLVSDTADFNIATYPNPTGTVRFYLYPPSDENCSGTPSFTSNAVPVNGRGMYASGNYTPTQAGTYQWIVDYSGDSNFEATSSYCGSYPSTVSKAGASLSSSATNATIGSSISDTATLTGGQSPTGTLTFKSYGPNDTTCSGTAAFAPSNVTVSGNGDYDSGDFTPTQAGAYRWTVSYSGDTNNAPAISSCNTANETSTVSKAAPTVTLQSASSAVVGTSISATGSVASGYQPTGTITFRAYGPDDADCSDTAAYTDSDTVDGNSDYSGNALPNQAGDYHWIISYSGDSENQNAVTSCSTLTSTVTKAEVSISTSATDAAITEPISDTATITGGFLPGGTIIFEVYGPDDTDCSGASVFTSTVTVVGNDDYGSGDFTPTTAGVYRWTADYSGDANNDPASSACNAVNGSSTVSKAGPAVSEPGSSDVTVGSALSVQTELSGAHEATGTITFAAYGPNDDTCSQTAAFTSGPVTVDGNGTYGTNDSIPTVAGTYHWIVSYSGDANNDASVTACSTEVAEVEKARPTISPTASDSTVGEPIASTVTVSNGYNPGGTIKFYLFGRGDTECDGDPVYTHTAQVDGNGAYGSGDFLPQEAGTYSWVVVYSGDVNNGIDSRQCGSPGGISTVGKAIPKVTGSASGNIRLGEVVNASATFSGGFELSGLVTFSLYGPDDANCSGAPAFRAEVAVNDNGTVTSPDFKPAATGTYRWTASYSGDANNTGFTGTCAAGLPVEVSFPTCPAVDLTAAPYIPAQIKNGNKARGVRARIKVSRPSLLTISATLGYTVDGKRRTTDFDERSLRDGGTRNFRIVLPKQLRNELPLFSKVKLTLEITATPNEPKGCTSPPTTVSRLKTRVVRILSAPQHRRVSPSP